MFKNKLLISSVFLLAIGLQACKREGCTDPNALNYDANANKDVGCIYEAVHEVEMHFHPYVHGDALFEGNTYTIEGVATTLNYCRFYVSNIRLVNAAGEEIVAPEHYLYVQPDPDEYSLGDIPDGDYTAIRFDIGIDSATNHGDPSLYPLGDPLGAQSPNMHWGWLNGYIFLRIDGEADSNADGTPDDAFEMHIGTDDFLVSVEIPYDLTVSDQTENIFHMDANWEQLFVGVDLANDNTSHTTDNLTLANIIKNNIPNFIQAED
ncbi:MAG: MbnP family protein [Chitinophagales bacterium]